MVAAKYKIVRKCTVCGEEFFAKTLESWYCSPKCSKIAWKRKHDEEKRLLALDEIVKKIPEAKEYISITEAYAMFGISRSTIYRLIYMKKVSCIEPKKGIRLVSKEELMRLYPFVNHLLTPNQENQLLCIGWNQRTAIQLVRLRKSFVWMTVRYTCTFVNILFPLGR